MRLKPMLSKMLAGGLILASAASHALTIGFSPTPQTVFTGQTASVNVVMSGLDDINQALTGYIIRVSYGGDPTVSFLGGGYTAALGNAAALISGPATGTIDLSDFFAGGAAGEAALAAAQGNSLVLATLDFSSASPVVSALSITFAADSITGLLDPISPDPLFPLPTVLDPGLLTGSLSWINRPNDNNVPVPGTLMLLLGPLAWLARRRHLSA